MTADPAPGAGLVEVVIEEPRWSDLDMGGLAERAAAASLVAVGMTPAGHEISLLACDDARIAELNAAFRGKEKPTNVLSWPSGELDEPARPGLEEEAIFLGDLALAFETCSAEAAEAGLSLEAHVTHLVVHGVLHLLGFDHEEDEEADEMERIEIKTLASLGVANPYT
ncbi:rRNA maturation RNase YbeY [Amaricoccus macauensis]|uniref:rRNA maturation RNase YbeY n=1 Tax=Amaricoccus macauensis TaxID=57001 RepID=UPI003C79B2F0